MGKSIGDNSKLTDYRVLKVAKYILDGYSKRSFLLQVISEKEDWGVSERQIDNYIAKAKATILNEFTEKELNLEKDIAINRLEGLYVMNIKIQDYREARNVTMDRMKLMGLNVDKTESKNETTHKGKIDINPIEWT